MDLNALLEAWARWVHRGGHFQPQTSVLGQLIDNKGVMHRGAGGSKPLDINSFEADIEAALMRYSLSCPESVLWLRIEYGALRLRGVSSLSSQREKAAVLKVSLRTYQTRLASIKRYLAIELGV